MRALALFIMQGRYQAAIVAAGLAISALLVPPLSLLSSASLGLVALREGSANALIVAVLASLGLCAVSLGLFGSLGAVLALALLLWLPMLSLGAVLRASRSLAMTIEAALAICFLVLLFFLIWSEDPISQWRDLVVPLVQAVGESQNLSQEQQVGLLEQVLRWMTGAMAAGLFFQMALSLFLARWWQAMLYNPGGFAVEFRLLRMHRFLAYIGLFMMLLWVMDSAQEWIRSLSLVLASAYFLQGLAVAHCVTAKNRLRIAWLTALYVAVLMAMPYAALLLAILGFADTWVDFRTRLTK